MRRRSSRSSSRTASRPRRSPNAAHKIPAACDYFPSTISTIEDKRYGAIPQVIRKEIADAGGYGVYTGIVDLATQKPAVSPAAASAAGATPPPAATAPPTARATLQRQVLPRSAQPSGTSAPAAPTQQDSAGLERTAAGLVLDPKDATSGTVAAQRRCYFANKTDQGQRAKDITSRQDDATRAIKGLGAGVDAAAVQTSLAAYEKDSPGDASYANDKSAVDKAVTALKASAAEAAAFQVLSAAWLELVATVETPTMSESVATQQMRVCAAKQTGAGEIACSVALVVRDAAAGETASLPGDLQRVEAAFLDAANAKLGTHATDANVAALIAAIARGDSTAAATAVTSICASNRPCNDALGLIPPVLARQAAATLEQILSLTSTLATAYGKADTGCTYCSLVASLATATEGVVQDLQSKDYGAAAGDTMDTVDQMACEVRYTSTSKDGCTDDESLVYKFLRSLAVYSVDSLTSGSGSTQTADADFRAAAVDLIEAYGGLGVRRSLAAKAQGLYVPEFSLREGWRPGLVAAPRSASAANQLLVYPSIEMVRTRFRLPTRQVYLAAHGSLFDPLGPFVEVATRSGAIDNAGTDPGVVALALVVPRVDFEVGLPDLSKNLVVGFGGAFRMFRIEPESPSASRYCVLLQSDSNCNASPTAGNFEFSVFAKFVP